MAKRKMKKKTREALLAYTSQKPTPTDPICEVNGEWWWANETWTEWNGPYSTEGKAEKALFKYAKSL